MTSLVTGSSGHLGEALMRTLHDSGEPALGVDIIPSPWTDQVGSVADGPLIRELMKGVQTVFHTATLHKPHVATHDKREFVTTNITGTLTLLEAAIQANVRRFIFTSTTSVFGQALRPAQGTSAAWITEDVVPIPRNIYGVTKTAAEDLCFLQHSQHGLACVVLRTARFFPEEDDDRARRERFADENLKANEYLYRRVDLQDVVDAHLCARDRACELGFGRYIISASSPFRREDLPMLNRDAPRVVASRCPAYEQIYRQRGYRMLDHIDRVYVNQAARQDLGWDPAWDFDRVLAALGRNESIMSPLAAAVGAKGYHETAFENGPFPVED